MLSSPFSEAKTVLERCAEVPLPCPTSYHPARVAAARTARRVIIVPTVRAPGQGDKQVSPLLELGTLLGNTIDAMRYGLRSAHSTRYIVNGQRTVMETCWLPAPIAPHRCPREAWGPRSPPAVPSHARFQRGSLARARRGDRLRLRRDLCWSRFSPTFVDRLDRSEEERTSSGSSDAWRLAVKCFPWIFESPRRERTVSRKSFGATPAGSSRPNAHDPDNVFRSAIPLRPVRPGISGACSSN